MYCEECKKRPPTVHVTKIINGKKFESNLCSECAQKHQELGGFQPSFSVPNFLAALFSLNSQVEEQVAPSDIITCAKCGQTFEQITQTGRLGCSECYDQFADRLESLLRRIQGKSQHVGKVPLRRGGSIRQRKQVEKLREEMQQYISREEFEQAAKVRDQIRNLEQGLGGLSNEH